VTSLAPTTVVVEPRFASASKVKGQVKHIYTQDPLPGINFELWTATEQKVGMATSGSDGSFVLENAPAGELFVLASVAAEDNCFNDPTEKTVTVVEGEDAEIVFGFVPGPCE